MRHWTRSTGRALLLATAAIGFGTTAAMAGPSSYGLLTTLAVPSDAANMQPGGAFTSFDIGFFDSANNSYYIADRSNASIDIYSGSSLSFLGRATGFTGQAATTSRSGADGVVAVTTGGTTTLYGGDGNSTLKVFNATNPASPSLLQSISTGGSFRVDEMAYSPSTHQILAANNADSPAFATLFQTTGGTSPVTIGTTNISIPGAAASDGMEQPVWNPNTGTFFVSIPAFNGDQGGVAQIDTSGSVLSLYKFASMVGAPSSCGPAGLALGASGNLLVGCSSGGGAVLLNPTANGGAGAILKVFPQITGTDEIWYDPTTGDFFVTGKDASGNRVFDVINDASESLISSTLLPVAAASNPHSIAVDSLTGDVFVPLAGSTATVPNSFCSLGCIAVYEPIPEPSSAPLMAIALVGMVGFAGWRLRKGA